MKSKHNSHELQRIDSLYDKITTLIEHARKSIVKNVNSIETYCKFETGKFIIEDELEGKYRASYGKKVLILLSEKLTNKYGHGWSVETLTLCRKFYTVYSKIVNTFTKLIIPLIQNLSNIISTFLGLIISFLCELTIMTKDVSMK